MRCPANPSTGPSSNSAASAPSWRAPAPLGFWHLASLDAPTVAAVWSCAFAWAARVRLPAWTPILLALIVWSVYIADRLLDARAGMRTPPLHHLRERHLFHWRYRRILAPLGLAAALFGTGLVVTRLPAGARAPDSALAALTLAYFSGVHSRRSLPSLLSTLGSRPFLIGILFTSGCLLPLWGCARPPLGRLLLPGLFFAALAWLNCRAIAQWETSLPGAGQSRIQPAALAIGLSGVALALLLAGAYPRAALLLAAGAVSALLLALLHRRRARLTPLALRAAADLVLLTPALLLPFGRPA